MIDIAFLPLLRCPISQGHLTLAGDYLVEQVNQGIRVKKIANRAGDIISRSLDAALVSSDGATLYPIQAGIISLLVDEAIDLEQIGVDAEDDSESNRPLR